MGKGKKLWEWASTKKERETKYAVRSNLNLTNYLGDKLRSLQRRTRRPAPHMHVFIQIFALKTRNRCYPPLLSLHPAWSSPSCRLFWKIKCHLLVSRVHCFSLDAAKTRPDQTWPNQTRPKQQGVLFWACSPSQPKPQPSPYDFSLGVASFIQRAADNEIVKRNYLAGKWMREIAWALSGRYGSKAATINLALIKIL